MRGVVLAVVGVCLGLAGFAAGRLTAPVPPAPIAPTATASECTSAPAQPAATPSTTVAPVPTPAPPHDADVITDDAQPQLGAPGVHAPHRPRTAKPDASAGAPQYDPSAI
jgi:hypothetical protein